MKNDTNSGLTNQHERSALNTNSRYFQICHVNWFNLFHFLKKRLFPSHENDGKAFVYACLTADRNLLNIRFYDLGQILHFFGRISRKPRKHHLFAVYEGLQEVTLGTFDPWADLFE